MSAFGKEERDMCHVLIIEDEPLVAMLLQHCLEEEGAQRHFRSRARRSAP